MALSVTRIKALKPKKAPYEVADAGGLFIEVLPRGAKVWRYRYRLNGGRGLKAWFATLGITRVDELRIPDQRDRGFRSNVTDDSEGS